MGSPSSSVSVVGVRVATVAAVDGRAPVTRHQGLRLVPTDTPGQYRLDAVTKNPVVGEPGQLMRLRNTRTRETVAFSLDAHGHVPPRVRIDGEAGDVIRIATSDGHHNADFDASSGAVIIPPALDPTGAPTEPRRLRHAPAELRRLDGPLFHDAPQPATVQQGDIGDCWLVATCDVVALRNPDLIKRLITDHGDGTFSVVFQRYDRDQRRYVPETIRVTNQFYCAPHSTKPVYGHTSTGELWFPVIEKAYAAWKGGYDGAYSGYPYEIFEALLGREGRHFDLDVTSTEAVWRTLQKRDAAGELMVAWSKVASPSLHFANTGLVADHAYAVFGVFEKDGERRVLLRNPWGENPWASKAGGFVVEQSRGVLSMKLEDFRRFFTGLGCVDPA